MTHRKLPAAPFAVVSGISYIAQIPTIIDARAGRDKQLTIEIMLSEEFQLQDDVLAAIAEYCGASIKDVAVRLAPGEDIIAIVEINNTTFDFDYMFPSVDAAVEGVEHALTAFSAALRGDSDESWEASTAISTARAS